MAVVSASLRLVIDAAAEIRFLQFRGSPIAFGVSGDGPPPVAAAWWVSHLELDWQDDACRSFWGSVASGNSLIRYDHPGFGLSGRDLAAARLALDDQVELLGAVMDELGLERASLIGGSSASTRPAGAAYRVNLLGRRAALRGVKRCGDLTTFGRSAQADGCGRA